VSKWSDFKEGVREEFKEVFKFLNPPSSDEEILSIEQRIGCSLPKEFVSLYKDCNGENDQGVGVCFGMKFLSIQEIHREMDSWEQVISDGLDDLNDGCTSSPKNAIQLVYANENWVPIFSDGGGNFIGMDFAPGPKGKAGQIINFGADDVEKKVIAKTLDGLFTLMLTLSQKDYAGLNDDGSFHVDNLSFIDAAKLAQKLDKLVAQRSPDYGFYSIWVYPKPLSSLPHDYFKNLGPTNKPNFLNDFNISMEEASDFGRSMMQGGEVVDIERLIRHSMYAEKYQKKLLNACAKANILQTSVVVTLTDYNYDLRENTVQESNGVVYMGAYKVY